MFRYVIFDLDGTLLNTLDDLGDAGNYTCRMMGWPEHSISAYKYFVGNGMEKLVERFTPEECRTKDTLKAAYDIFMPYYDVHKEDKTVPYPGISKLLDRLKEAGVVFGVLTNKADHLARPVMERYFPGVFDYVQGALPGYPKKPDPTLLHEVMHRMGATKSDTLFVGDSNVDIRTAKNAGLNSCGVLWGFRTREELSEEGADLLAETAEELEQFILR